MAFAHRRSPVITGLRSGDALWICYDGTNFATAIDPADFFDDYEFVDFAERSTSDAIAN